MKRTFLLLSAFVISLAGISQNQTDEQFPLSVGVLTNRNINDNHIFSKPIHFKKIFLCEH